MMSVAFPTYHHHLDIVLPYRSRINEPKSQELYNEASETKNPNKSDPSLLYAWYCVKITKIIALVSFLVSVTKHMTKVT